MTENAADASSSGDPHGAGESARSVVVGVDGSDSSRIAAYWAADEAGRRGTRLTIVHALHLPDAALAGVEPAGHIQRRLVEGRDVLDQVAASVRTLHPDLPLDLELSDLEPAHALTGFSREAEVLVIGSGGHGGQVGALPDSVGRKLAGQAHCPFVVVHEQSTQDAAGPAALEPARREGATLTVVRVWIPSAQYGAGRAGIGALYIGSLEAGRRKAVEAAKAATEQLRKEFPDVLVQITADEGSTVTSLMAAARREGTGPADAPLDSAGCCCRLAHVESSAEVVFGQAGAWRDLARRAMSHGADCAVLGRFLDQWESILGLGAAPRSAPEVCNRCSQRRF
jgi:nucleotide-binding universal stress UspA family protein